MKTKAKLVLALSVLTAGTAVAGATGTFAWFTTNRSATLTYSKVTARNDHGTLDVVIGKLSDTGATVVNSNKTAEKDAEHSVVGAASSTTDISSADGATLVKPIWTKNAGNGSMAEKTVDAEWGKDYVVYYFGLKNEGASALNIFLDKGTAITATTTGETAQAKKDAALAGLTRVAVNDTGKTDAPAIDESTNSYTVKKSNTIMFETKANTTGNYLKPMAGAGKVEPATLPTNGTDYTHIVGDFGSVNSGSDNTHGQWLIKLAGGQKNYHYFTVTVWLEGTEADGEGFDACAGGSVDVNLQLVAYDAAA